MRYILLLLIIWGCRPKEVPEVAKDFEKPKIFIVNGGQNTLSVINTTTLAIEDTIALTSNADAFAHHAYINVQDKLCIATPEYNFSLGHGNLHTIDKPGGVVIIDAKTGLKLSEFTTPFVNHNAVLNPAGTEVWSAELNHSGQLHVFNAETGSILSTIQVDADPTEVIFSADSKMAFVACQESSFVSAIDTETKEEIKKIKVDPFPTSVYAMDSSQILVINANKRSINFIDTNTLNVVDFLDVDFIPSFASFNETTQELWICAMGTDKVYVYKKELEKWLFEAEIDSAGDPHQVQFFDGGLKTMVINQNANNAIVFDAQTKEIIKEIAVGKNPNGIAVWE